MSTEAKTPERYESLRSSAKTDWRVRPAYLFPVITLGIWAASVPFLPSEMLPSPARVFSFMWDEIRMETIARQSVYYHFGVTLLRLAVGTVVTMLIGTAIGVGAGLSRRFDAFTRDYVIAMLTMPGLVVALVAALWFGFTFFTVVFVVVVTTFSYTAINVAEGVRDVPRDLIVMSKAFGMVRGDVVRHVVIPFLTPFLVVSLRYTLSLGWKSLTIAEVFGAQTGAGWMLRFWYDAHRVYTFIGYSLFFALMTILIDRVFLNWVEKRMLAWRGDQVSMFSA